jgi:pentatricopeptide repeat protein
MYAHLGEFEKAISIFKSTDPSERASEVWYSIIGACGYHGKATMALELFNEMIKVPLVQSQI